MIDKAFIDTNILVYLYSNSEKQKQSIAKILIFEKELEIVVSTQVLSEFTNILYKKYGYSIDTIKKAIADFKNNFSISSVSTKTIDRALGLMKTYKYSYWDSLIMASAIENNCPILYSEDFQHNQSLEKKLKIVNPFKS
jgi:predicted nucleic acid-binding protein